MGLLPVFKVYLFWLGFVFKKSQLKRQIEEHSLKQEDIYVTVFGLNR